MLAASGFVTVLGPIAGLVYLAFAIYCAVVTLRKGHILLFVLGFFCGICWFIGFFSADKRQQGPGMDGHYVPPRPGT